MMSDIFSMGGEFLARDRETDYRTERFPESLRLMRRVFRYAAFANLLFYLNDLHFRGQPHFAAALAARTVIVAASFAGLAALRRITGPRQLQGLCLAWAAPVIAASAVLVSPHTDAALFIAFALPTLFYLALPIAFRWTMVLGLACSVALMAAYLSSVPLAGTSLGLVLGMLVISLVMTLVLNHSNRLRRLEWSATGAARRANQELTEHRELLRGILKSVPTPLVIMDPGSDHHLIQVNDAARAFFGEAAVRENLTIENYLDGSDLARLREQLQETGQVSDLELPLTFPDGRRRAILLAASVVKTGDSSSILAVLIDITERKESEARLRRLANTDPLTGLANRARFFAVAAQEIKRLQRYPRPLAVIMVDIDFFKQINDDHGHETGDLALQAFADLCRTCVRDQDLVARVGGEEFALLLPETSQADAFALAERLRSAVEHLRMDNAEVAMTISIGLAEVLPGEILVDPALSRADQALYSAKRTGRNQVIRYAAQAGA
ncbi:MAG: diguanylate cyclase [Holophaga sp.]|nr:diguanylate cyclase [Holophaga sp.]